MCLSIASHRIELHTAARTVSLCPSDQDASNDILVNVDLEVTASIDILVNVDLEVTTDDTYLQGVGFGQGEAESRGLFSTEGLLSTYCGIRGALAVRHRH